jgi:putative ABC transport system permease protein
MIAIWLRGIAARASARLAGAIAGVALTVALIGVLGAHVANSAATMTRQVTAGVNVDWQVQLNHGADPAAVRAAIFRATPVTVLKPVYYADVAAFEATQQGSTQTTGSGKVVGLPPGYAAAFPNEIRPNIGAREGALLFQQTAANLHATVGDVVTVRGIGVPPIRVRIDGIVAMPDIDTFFQAIGLPPGAAPQAPPDNVLLLPEGRWHAAFDRQSVVRPDSTRLQYHVRIAHDTLPPDPLAAYNEVTARAHNLEARVAGSAIVGDNLAAKLLGANADALYARVLFLFLGMPGVVLAALLTIAVAGSGGARRAREQALLRVRGASTAQLLQFAAVEAATVALGGVVVGIAVVATFDGAALATQLGWIGLSAACGIVLGAGAVLVPAWLAARNTTVAEARRAIGRPTPPLWERLGLDVIALAISAVAFWQTARTGYQVVLAPEGVPQASVHYDAFLAPLFLWLGAALLAARLMRLALERARPALRAALSGTAGRLAGVVAATLARRQRLVTRGALLTGLAFAFGVSTAVFNATYAAQSRVDAELTNGADVTITGSTAAPPSRILAQVRAIPGVRAAEPMQHRYAFVGNDLQDLYGVNPRTIGNATPMSDAFFGNKNAAATLAKLSATPDGVLVSEETVQTYQLRLGDQLILRLQDARTHRYGPVRFHFVGVSREFPTAPHDSFLIANASYVAQQTHTEAAEIVLIRTDPGAIRAVAAAARRLAAALPGATVTDIVQAQRTIGSTLTAVDVRGLTAIELAFAVLFVAAGTGLMLALGFAERLRTFAVLSALGASARQLRAFLASEALTIVIPGAVFGTALGFAVAQVLVVILTGVFDPPPEALTVPWGYLALLVLAAGASSAAAVALVLRATGGAVVGALRGL